MDQQEITARSIVDRYVRGELSEKELYEFEEYYFDHPEMLKEVALTEVMRDALRVAPRQILTPPVTGWQRLLARMATPAWSMAATAATIVFASLLVVETLYGPQVAPLRPDQPAGLRPGSVMPVVAQLDLVRMRGPQAGPPPIAHLKAIGVLSITIDASDMDPVSLQATLRGPAQSIDLPSLIPDPSLGVATIVMPTSDLAPGSYVLELRDGRGAHFAYTFEVAR